MSILFIIRVNKYGSDQQDLKIESMLFMIGINKLYLDSDHAIYDRDQHASQDSEHAIIDKVQHL